MWRLEMQRDAMVSDANTKPIYSRAENVAEDLFAKQSAYHSLLLAPTSILAGNVAERSDVLSNIILGYN
jgi:hypothetical protein